MKTGGGGIGPDRRTDRPMISPPCSSPEGSRGSPLASVFRYGKHNLLFLDPHSPIPTPPSDAPTRAESRRQDCDIFQYQMKYKSLLLRIPPDLHDALTRLRTQRHVNISAWVRAAIKSALEHEGMLIGTEATQPPGPAADPLPGWRPHLLDSGEWGSIYLGDTSGLPSELVGLTIVVQARNGQSWTTTVTAVLDRNSGQVIVTDSGRPDSP